MGQLYEIELLIQMKEDYDTNLCQNEYDATLCQHLILRLKDAPKFVFKKPWNIFLKRTHRCLVDFENIK